MRGVTQIGKSRERKELEKGKKLEILQAVINKVLRDENVVVSLNKTLGGAEVLITWDNDKEPIMFTNRDGREL